MAGVPKVFISSTYFDLRQVRASIDEALRTLGYDVLRSEHETFPIHPSLDTVQNCLKVVETEADILLLVIGGRYGFVDTDTDKSVTNLEYLAARAKGIPVYVFVDQAVLTALPIYERNPDADFSPYVENAALFEFVRRLRDEDRVWIRGFSEAREIVDGARRQLVYLLSDLLDLRRSLSPPENGWMRLLSAEAFRIVAEQPKAWEYRLFSQVLTDEVEALRELREEHKLEIAFGAGDQVSLDDFTRWSGAKIRELSRLMEALGKLIDGALPVALGPPGVPGDARHLVFVGRQLARIYKEAILWSQSIRRVAIPDEFERAVRAMAGFADQIIRELEAFGPKTLGQIREGLQVGTTDAPVKINATLKLELHNQAEYHQALKELSSKLR